MTGYLPLGVFVAGSKYRYRRELPASPLKLPDLNSAASLAVSEFIPDCALAGLIAPTVPHNANAMNAVVRIFDFMIPIPVTVVQSVQIGQCKLKSMPMRDNKSSDSPSSVWAVLGSSIFVWLSICLPAPAQTSGDAAIFLLQQDVLELKRIVQQQQQQIEFLQQQHATQSNANSPVPAARTGPQSAGAAASPPLWLNAAAWDRVKTGMVELDVVRLLGVPSTLRDAAGNRHVLYYAVEMGTGRFLSGSVTLADRKVTEVQRPTFK
jgi:hypothetical protein